MEFMQTYDLFGNEMAYAITIINFIIVSVMKKKLNFIILFLVYFLNGYLFLLQL